MREMRRKLQQLSLEETIAILEKNTSGVLSLLGEDGYPYGVPLSYVYQDHTLIFHGAKTGHKMDAIKHHDKASFCVIDQDEIVPEKFTTLYRSAIVFGKVRVLEDKEEIISMLQLLAKKYSPNHIEESEKEIKMDGPFVSIFILEIEHMSGKVGKGLLK